MTLAATQSLSDALIRELAPLREALKKRGTVMPVVGAGLSVPLRPCPVEHRLPTWKGLLEELIARVPDVQRANLASMLVTGQQPLVASELVHHLGRAEISTYIRQRFEKPRFERPSVYDALVALPIDHFLTTNYDLFLADAWATKYDAAPNVVTPRDDGALGNLRVDARPFILMLHGTAARPKTCVLSAEEFAGLQFGTVDYSQALMSLASQRRLLFLGHSLSDPDLSAILRECRVQAGEGAEFAHWFLGVDIDDAQRRYLASHGVQAIELATHGRFDVLETVLRELARPIELTRASATVSSVAQPSAQLEIPEGGPFPGLLPFDEQHEHFFCGREAETLDILGFLRNPPANSVRWVQIEGASGAGKSSLLRAGVVPPLRRGEVDGRRDGWRVAVIKPGPKPLRALASGLFEALGDKSLSIDGLEDDLRKYPDRITTLIEEEQRLPPGLRLVLAIDQFEEAFTFVNASSETASNDRACFGERLAEALRVDRGRCHLLTTVRRDYLEHMTLLPTLDALLGRAHRVNLPPMEAEKLLRSIEEPAERVGLKWDPPHLPKSIRDDALAQPGGLASLGLLMSELWLRRSDDKLTQQSYEDLHRVAGVLALRADELLARLRSQRVGDESWADGAVAMLVAMVRRDRDGFDRRTPITRVEAVRYAGCAAAGENVLEALSGQRPRDWRGEWRPAPRLVVVRDEGTLAQPTQPLVEVVHERLSREWPALDAAVGQAEQRMLWRDRLESQAEAWHDSGRRAQDLVSGPTLKAYAAAASEHALAQSYLDAATSKERRTRRTVVGLCIASALALIAAPAGWFLLDQQRALRANVADAEIAHALETLPSRWDDNWKDWAIEVIWITRTSLDPGAELRRWRARAEDRLEELERFLWRVQELESRSDLPPEDAWRRENANRLRAAITANRVRVGEVFAVAERLARWAETGSAAYGRAEQRRRWNEVLDSLAADPTTHPYSSLALEPRYDLLPMRQRASENPTERVWEFLVLGSGAEPRRDSEQGAWRMEADSGLVVALLPGGSFVMGSQSTDPNGPNFDPVAAEEDERPHTVTLSPFYLAAHELTQGQVQRLVDGTQTEDGSLPRTETWLEARNSCIALAGNLPTEAQWEYACRAGTTTRFWRGDADAELAEIGWFAANSEMRYHAVGEKRDAANPWGLFDMHGNVCEWCADWYGPYSEDDATDPTGAPTGSERVVRGGEKADPAESCRSANRWSLDSDKYGTLFEFGIRVALSVARGTGNRSIFDP